MASNNYAEVQGKPAVLDPADYRKAFLVLIDNGKQQYDVSCHRTSSMPTLDDIEYCGQACAGRQVAKALEAADESEVALVRQRTLRDVRPQRG